MKRTIRFILLLVCLPSITWCQVNTDSLQKVINSNRPYEQQIDASIKLLENYELKDFDYTISLGNDALKLARKNKDSIAVAEVKRHIGVASYFQGKFDEAARHYYDAIDILEKRNEPGKLAPVYNELAKLYRKTRDLEKASENYQKAETIFRQLKDTGGISMILNESGVVYEYKEDYKEAVNRYSASLKLAESRGDSLGVSYSLSNIAGVKMIEEKFAEAERYLLRSLAIRETLNDSFSIALIYYELGRALNGKRNFEKANEYLTSSVRIAQQLGYPDLLSNNYTELAAVAQRQGKFQDAYNYNLKRGYLRDSLFDLEKTKQIEEMRAQYDTEEKEQQIRQQEERLRMQNYIFIGIGGLLLLLGLLVYSYYRRNKLRQETKMKTQLMQQQENAVKAVIEAEENERQRIAEDLHDGVGQMMSAAKMNLSAFESEIKFDNGEQRKAFEKIIELVDESCREVRTVSHIMMPNALLKNNLSIAIREFVDKLSSKELAIHVDTEGMDQRLDSNIETVLYRVVQECVTNAIRHAGANTLDISLVRDKEGISGTIEDNGKGFDPTEKDKFEGIGLKNIISRIEYLKGTVDFDSAPGRGTVVAFHVPV